MQVPNAALGSRLSFIRSHAVKAEFGNWPIWITVAVLGMGVLATRLPLQSARPHVPALVTAPRDSEQSVVARLWRDPLVAVSPKAGGPKEENYKEPQSPSESGTPLVVPVIVPGGPYSVDSELRIRARYAVAMALLDTGYEPKDADHLGRWQPKAGEHSWTTVAFEWWVSRHGVEKKVEARPILLLWVSEDDLAAGGSEGYCRRLSSLLSDMPWTIARPIHLRIVGPCSSDGLTALARGLPSITAQPHLADAKIPIYSPYATIAADQLGEELPSNFQRTIASDAKLADVLVDELVARDVIAVAPKSACDNERHDAPTPQIVLLSEYDTEYGRHWPVSFNQSLHNKLGPANDSVVVRQFFYLRGLDELQGSAGRGEAARATSLSTSDPVQPLLQGQLHGERPAGNSQFDYARRLARAIKDSETTEKPIKAIGICGTDVFDKLLLLQAMRDEFPGRVFFTTDLDAALLMPDQYRWTRNLIVASSYDLRLGARLQGQAPPFRDCYQTSVFIATKLAVGDKDMTYEVDQRCECLFPPARVYEIGRSGAFDLRLPLGGESDSVFFPDQPAPLRTLIQNRVLLVAGLIGLLLLLAYIRHNSLGLSDHVIESKGDPQGSESAARRKEFGYIGLVSAIAIGAALLGSAVTYVVRELILNDSHPEPLALFDGISVWPTQAIRLITLILAIVFIIMLIIRWRRVRDVLCSSYKIPPPSETPREGGHWVLGWQRPKGPANFALLWSQYEIRAHWTRRLLRAAILASLYYAIGILLFKGMSMPMKPIRGDIARLADSIIYICVPAMLLLNFLVWDATRLCARFIRLLTCANSRTIYPALMLTTIPRVNDGVAASILDTRIVAKLTEQVGRAVYYPLTLIFLMILARSQVFDNWHVGAPLIIVIGGSFLLTFVSGLGLRKAAESCRATELEWLRKEREQLGPIPGPTEQSIAIDRAIAEIENNAKGAFARFQQDPILGPLLVPASGSIALLAIDYLANRA